MEKVNNVLKRYRKLRGISLEELAVRSGVPKSTLNRYENNNNQKIDIKNFIDITRVLEIPAIEIELLLLDGNIKRCEVMAKIPVVGEVCAGRGIIAQEDILGYETVEERYGTDEYFFLSVKGDSMSPHIADGDLVLVKKQESVESGEIAVVIVDDENGMIKKVEYDTNALRLVSFNPYHPDMTFDGDEMNRVFVVGKVIESKRKW